MSTLKSLNWDVQEARNKRYVKAFAIMTAVCCVTICTMPAFAASNITRGISSGMQKVWTMLVSIAGYVAILSAAISGVNLIIGDAKDAGEAKKKFIRIVIGALIVLMAPTIIQTIFSWFPKSSWVNSF